MEISDGAHLARLLLANFDAMVAQVVDELAREGHPGVTATLEFALRGIDDGAGNASELGRRLGVTKQASARSIAALEQLGYLARSDDPLDRRRRRLIVSARGYDMMRIGGEGFDRIRAAWIETLGPERVREIEISLQRMLDRGRTIPTS